MRYLWGASPMAWDATLGAMEHDARRTFSMTLSKTAMSAWPLALGSTKVEPTRSFCVFLALREGAL